MCSKHKEPNVNRGTGNHMRLASLHTGLHTGKQALVPCRAGVSIRAKALGSHPADSSWPGGCCKIARQKEKLYP